jgi:hypothetical protein
MEPTMSLDETRAALNALLDRSDVCTRFESSWDAAKADIEAWWSDYQLFEQGESFQRAFDDQRMTVRWSKRGLDAKIDLQAVPQGRANPQKFPKQAAPLEGVAARFAQHQPAEVFGLDLGIRGVVRRTGPAIFCAGSGNSRKAELGLHDLSASLLRKKDIASQLFNELKRGDLYVFMPLPLPADQAVFQRLNGLAKERRAALKPLYDLVRGYRSLMTRVKLACEHDMGTNFVALAPDSRINPRFRYGLGRLTKRPVKGADGQDTAVLQDSVANDAQIIAARRQAAINYRQILERELFTVNEITIAYRQHRNPLFALFAEWDGQNFCAFGLTGFGKSKTGRPKISSLGVFTA